MTNHYMVHLSASEHAALHEIKMRIEKLFPVEQFILFGSKARGDFNEFSDVDILAVTTRALSGVDKRKVSDAVFEVNVKLNTQFCVLSVSSGDFHSDVWSRLPLLKTVVSEGVPV